MSVVGCDYSSVFLTQASKFEYKYFSHCYPMSIGAKIPK